MSTFFRSISLVAICWLLGPQQFTLGQKTGHVDADRPRIDRIREAKQAQKELEKEGIVFTISLKGEQFTGHVSETGRNNALKKNVLINYVTMKDKLQSFRLAASRAINGRNSDTLTDDENRLWMAFQLSTKSLDYFAEKFADVDKLKKEDRSEFIDLFVKMLKSELILPSVGIKTTVTIRRGGVGVGVRSNRDRLNAKQRLFRDAYVSAYERIKVNGWDRFFQFPKVVDQKVEFLRRL